MDPSQLTPDESEDQVSDLYRNRQDDESFPAQNNHVLSAGRIGNSPANSLGTVESSSSSGSVSGMSVYVVCCDIFYLEHQQPKTVNNSYDFSFL